MAAQNPNCKIGRIFPKSGGATVRLIPQKHDAEVAITLEHFKGWSERLADQFSADMAGYAIVVWDKTGRSRTEVCVSDLSPFGPRLLPAFASECLSCDLTERVVREVLKGK